MTFQIGDKVIYPNHGLGVVQGIETKTILGTTCGFYHLRMVANETTVLVPVDNVDGVRLRRAINDAALLLRRILDEQPNDLRADEPGGTGDEDSHARADSMIDRRDVAA